MGIFSRTRDIVAANVNDLLDRAEDPAKTIRLVIMEMEETLDEVRASAARAIADQKERRRAIAKLGQAQQGWAEKAELALSKGREDLAKAALVVKRECAENARQIEGELTALDEQLGHHETDIAKLEAKLREARARQSGIVSRLETAGNRLKMREMTKGPRVDEAFARFEQLERRVDYAEGRVEAYDLAPASKTLDQQIAELKAGDEVQAELDQMKSRMSLAKEG